MVLDDQEVSTILGKSVRSSAGEDMGRIVDIDWHALNFAPAGKPGSITLELTRNQVRLAPEYKRGEPVVVVGAVGTERAMPSGEVAAPER